MRENIGSQTLEGINAVEDGFSEEHGASGAVQERAMGGESGMQQREVAEQSGGRKGRKRNVFYRVWAFYRDGIRSMTLGRTLWILVLIKLFIMFAILRVFFFPRHMQDLKTDEQKAEYVIEQLSKPNQ